jgi:predicted pyridoxine 5'-phosphate oxidase superfamily flavin-nucleotide-binding protein
MARTKKEILTRRVREFLRAPRPACLATIGADGYPHVIPIWGKNFLGARRRNNNDRADPRPTVKIVKSNSVPPKRN